MENKKEQQKDIKSVHIFTMPFKFEGLGELLLKEKILWTEFEPTESPDKDKEEIRDLMKYLNRYAKDSLFKYGKKSKAQEFHYNIQGNLDFIIISPEKDKKYNLNLSKVVVKFFDLNVGNISFFLENYEYGEIEDILFINDEGRNLYEAYEKHKISTLSIIGKDIQVIEDFQGENFNTVDENLKENKIISHFLDLKDITPILDYRMYVQCIYHTDFWEKAKETLYEFIYIDKLNAKSCQDEDMEKKILSDSLYTRWNNYGTLYGVSRHSFVALSQKNHSISREEDFTQNILIPHVKNHYFQMISLAIAQKTAILSLNERINLFLIKENEDKNEDKNKIYEDYLTFISKMNFKEITYQEQGIELYNLIRKQLRIEELLQELDSKIKILYEHTERQNEIQEEEYRERLEDIIQNIVVPIGIFSVISSFSETDLIDSVIIKGIHTVLFLILIPWLVYGVSDYIKHKYGNINWMSIIKNYRKKNAVVSVVIYLVIFCLFYIIKIGG